MYNIIKIIKCRLYEMAALKPPFRANDMKGLYNKIMKGTYERIPTMYSQDLHNIISSLLKVSYFVIG
jgi:NIMA (never in mitosis gene a)-related kinase 1/4/5